MQRDLCTKTRTIHYMQRTTIIQGSDHLSDPDIQYFSGTNFIFRVRCTWRALHKKKTVLYKEVCLCAKNKLFVQHVFGVAEFIPIEARVSHQTLTVKKKKDMRKICLGRAPNPPWRVVLCSIYIYIGFRKVLYLQVF